MRYTIHINKSFRIYLDTLKDVKYYIYNILEKTNIEKIIDNWTGFDITSKL